MVSLLWSIANDAHEKRIGAIIEEMAPGAFVSLASDMVNRIGDYERTVAAVVNSLIGPEMTSYLSRTRASLATRGFSQELGIMTYPGGLVDATLAQRRPILTIGSGPVAGVVGSQALARRGDAQGPGADGLARLNVMTADIGAPRWTWGCSSAVFRRAWPRPGPDPVYDGAGFASGMTLTGPAIVEYPDTTLVLRGRQVARVSETGSVVIEIDNEESI